MGFYTSDLSAVAIRAKEEPGASRGVVLKKRAVRFFRGARRQDSLSRQTKSPASTAFHAVVLRTTAPGVPLYGYRHLNPKLGRWANRDPIWERASQPSRQSAADLILLLNAEVARLQLALRDVELPIDRLLELKAELRWIKAQRTVLRSGAPSFTLRSGAFPSVSLHPAGRLLKGEELYSFVHNRPLDSWDVLGLSCHGRATYCERNAFCDTLTDNTKRGQCRGYANAQTQVEWDNWCNYLENW